MSFSHPEAAVLLVLAGVAAWLYPALGLLRPLRLATALTLVIFAMGPRWRTNSAGLDLWVLVDQSASHAEETAAHLDEWRRLLEEGRGAADRVRELHFAADAQPGGPGERFEGARDATRTALALRAALAAKAPGRSSRLLLFTDGFATEPLDGLDALFFEAGVSLDVRLAEPPTSRDLAVNQLDAADRVRLGEPVLLDVALGAGASENVAYTVLRDGVEVHRGTAAAPGRLQLTDRPLQPGAHRYEIRIDARDARAGNDHAERWVEVVGGPNILVLSRYSPDPVVEALSGHFQVRALPPSEAQVGHLSGARVVVLNDVPASALAPEFMRALPFYVEGQGGGLVMLGGRYSFGTGGYYESPLDPLLPVSLELKREHHKLAVALALVLDRSCSMGASVEGGHTKMDLANDGAARAVELLGERDQLAVFAVDSAPHRVVPMISVGGNQGSVMEAIRQIEPGGGGIYVFEGLSAGWEALRGVEVGQRHLILFSDAADSEEPGDYQALLKTMRAQKATVSVIALGKRTDPDATLLEDIALRGEGRLFFSDDAREIPALFAQETVAVARSAFIEEPAPLVATGGWMELAAQPLAWPAAVNGYNLTYPRPGATMALLTLDQEKAPLLAAWTRATGKVAAVTFPLAGPHSDAVRAWPQYGDLVQTLVRYAAGNEIPAGVALLPRVVGSELQLVLAYDQRMEDRLAGGVPRLVLGPLGAGAPENVAWERLSPNRFMARYSLRGEAPVRGAVQLGDAVLPFGPIGQARSAEWAFLPQAPGQLLALAKSSGGGLRTRLSEVWQAPRPAEYADRSAWLWTLALLLILLEALLVRLGVAQAPIPVERLLRKKNQPPPSTETEAREARFARVKKL